MERTENHQHPNTPRQYGVTNTALLIPSELYPTGK